MKHDFPIFDKRDGAKDAGLQFEPLGKILGLPWNSHVSRGFSGFYDDSHKKHLSTLIRRAKKAGEKILGASISNYGVDIIVSIESAEHSTK